MHASVALTVTLLRVHNAIRRGKLSNSVRIQWRQLAKTCHSDHVKIFQTNACLWSFMNSWQPSLQMAKHQYVFFPSHFMSLTNYRVHPTFHGFLVDSSFNILTAPSTLCYLYLASKLLVRVPSQTVAVVKKT